MAQQTVALTERPAWNALRAHHRSVAGIELRRLFAEDPKRGERLALEAAGVYLDYSKNRVTEETLACSCGSRRNRRCASVSTPCSAAIRSTSPRTAR